MALVPYQWPLRQFRENISDAEVFCPILKPETVGNLLLTPYSVGFGWSHSKTLLYPSRLNLLELPDEIKLLICSALDDIPSLVLLGSTCKKLYDLVNDALRGILRGTSLVLGEKSEPMKRVPRWLNSGYSAWRYCAYCLCPYYQRPIAGKIGSGPLIVCEKCYYDYVIDESELKDLDLNLDNVRVVSRLSASDFFKPRLSFGKEYWLPDVRRACLNQTGNTLDLYSAWSRKLARETKQKLFDRAMEMDRVHYSSNARVRYLNHFDRAMHVASCIVSGRFVPLRVLAYRVNDVAWIVEQAETLASWRSLLCEDTTNCLNPICAERWLHDASDGNRERYYLAASIPWYTNVMAPYYHKIRLIASRVVLWQNNHEDEEVDDRALGYLWPVGHCSICGLPHMEIISFVDHVKMKHEREFFEDDAWQLRKGPDANSELAEVLTDFDADPGYLVLWGISFATFNQGGGGDESQHTEFYNNANEHEVLRRVADQAVDTAIQQLASPKLRSRGTLGHSIYAFMCRHMSVTPKLLEADAKPSCTDRNRPFPWNDVRKAFFLRNGHFTIPLYLDTLDQAALKIWDRDVFSTFELGGEPRERFLWSYDDRNGLNFPISIEKYWACDIDHDKTFFERRK